jgi:uncharacterized membrane protein YfcA
MINYTYILVFFTMMSTDFFWGVYIKAMAKHQAITASIFGAFIMLCGAFTAISYIEDHWALIPATIGGMIGTYISAKYSNVKDDNGTTN